MLYDVLCLWGPHQTIRMTWESNVEKVTLDAITNEKDIPCGLAVKILCVFRVNLFKTQTFHIR